MNFKICISQVKKQVNEPDKTSKQTKTKNKTKQKNNLRPIGIIQNFLKNKVNNLRLFDSKY